MTITSDQRSFLRHATQAANGMLPVEVYEKLYESTTARPMSNIVEIGTAHGAATIALALGQKSINENCKIYTVDRLGGKFSSRSGYGSVDENKRIISQNFKRAEIDEMVEIFVGSSDDFARSNRAPVRIDLLLLDADGRIDRDLLHFYPLLKTGDQIIIDDVDDGVYLNKNFEGKPYIDLKHRITHLLIARFEKEGFLTVNERIRDTAFCERGSRDFCPETIRLLAIDCYRELVFSDVSGLTWQELAEYPNMRSEILESLHICRSLPHWFFKVGLHARKIKRKLQGRVG